MYKVYAITCGASLIKVGILSDGDCFPTTAHNLAIIYCVPDLDTAVGLARRVAGSLGSCSDKIVYMASTSDGEPLYVGMGRPDRHLHITSGVSHVKEANEYDGEMVVEVLHQGLTKKEASKIEHQLISELKPRWNRNSGGVFDCQDEATELDDLVKNHRVKPKFKVKPKISKPKKNTNEYVFRPEDHLELYRELFAIGDGQLKAGELVNEAMKVLEKYSHGQSSEFLNYITGGDSIKVGFRFKPSGKVLRRFLRNLGIEVVVKSMRVHGSKTKVSSLCPSSFIRGASMDIGEAAPSNGDDHGKVIEMILKEIRQK